MKILLVFPRENIYTSQSVRELPSGGTEKVVTFLSEALTKKGHTCLVATTLEEALASEVFEPDVLITQHASLFAKDCFKNAKKIWWLHHFSDQPIVKQGAMYGRVFADKVITLSKIHHDDIKAVYGLKSEIIGHGIWLDEVVTDVEKDPYRLIYASTPFRGLERIPALFKKIKEAEPRATIAICSSMGTYGLPEQDAEYSDLFRELEGMAGVELKGSLNQAELYSEMARASVFFYPCIWAETYCCVMDEAVAHGCIPVVTDLGALPERANATKTLGGITLEEICERNAIDDLSLVSPRDWMDVVEDWEQCLKSM